MKRKLFTVLTLVLTLGTFSLVRADKTEIVLTVDEPMMTVNGTETNIDENGTTPVIVNGRTLVPIRAIIEAMGGSVAWNAETKTAALKYADSSIELTIDSTTAYLDGESKELDTTPAIINGRTMLPLRFVAEGFGFDTDWNGEAKSITVSRADEAEEEEQLVKTDNEAEKEQNVLVLYFTRAENIELTEDIDAVSSASLNKIDGEIVGNTKIAADIVHEKVGGDMVGIEVTDLYPSDYNVNVDQADSEIDKNSRPEIKTHIDDFDKYDVVYLGTSLWWGKMPMPVYSFIEAHNFDGKTVIPFTTHGGSGMGSVQSDLEKLLPNANVVKGFSIKGESAADSKEEVLKKLDDLKF